MIIVGLDPGMKAGGGTVCIHTATSEVVYWDTWKADSKANGYIACAKAAKRTFARLDKTKGPLVLVHESVYIPAHIERFNSVKAAAEYAKRGRVTIRGKYGWAPLSLAESVGVWVCMFPSRVIPIPAPEWRKILEVNLKGPRGGKRDVKVAAAERILELLPPAASRLRAAIARGNHHLSDAAGVALAGARMLEVMP